MEYKKAIITFWFKELKKDIYEGLLSFENSLSNYFKVPFEVNKMDYLINIGVPRIIAFGIDNDLSFNMSLVNLNLVINLVNLTQDEIMLKINEMTQVIYDNLKSTWPIIDIIYAAIKIEGDERVISKYDIQKELLKYNDNEYVDFAIKTSLDKDDKYYINHEIALTKEIKVNVMMPNKENLNEADLLMRSMLVSLENSTNGDDIKHEIFEINNRLSFNNDSNYIVSKDELRSLLYEFRLYFLSIK